MRWVGSIKWNFWSLRIGRWGQVAAFRRRSDVHEVQTQVDAIDPSTCNSQQVANTKKGLSMTDTLASSESLTPLLEHRELVIMDYPPSNRHGPIAYLFTNTLNST